MTFSMPAGPVTTAELLRNGVSRHQLRALIASGELRRAVRGVLVPADLEDTLDLRARAVAAAVSPGHIAIDRTAAWIHGVDTLTSDETTMLPRIETATRPEDRVTDRTDVIGRQRSLTDGDVMTVGGLQLTTPRRTALDLGCQLRRREAFAALNEFARIHHLDATELRAELPRFRGRRGVIQLRELLEYIDARIESPRESWTLIALIDAGIPIPEPQVWIEIDGVPTYRLDLGWRLKRVAVEYDGVADHLRTDEQRAADQRRRQHLTALGWTVIVVRNGDFHGRRLEAWLSQVRSALCEPTYSPLRFRPTA
jgi:hypothetical protein